MTPFASSFTRNASVSSPNIASLMATVSALQAPKRKKNVYGKLGRPGFGTTNLGSFFDDDDDELVTSKPTIERQPNIKAAYSVQKTEARAHVQKPARPRAKRQNTFDVPSSDDEISPPPKIVSPPKLKPKLVDDTNTSSTQLAPWEKKRLDNAEKARHVPVKKRKSPEWSPEAQLRQELARATASPENSPTSPKSKAAIHKQTIGAASPIKSGDVNASSAAARLAARRKLDNNSAPSSADETSKAGRAVPKRSVLAADESENTPRKRVRTATESKEDNEDVVMDDASYEPTCEVTLKENQHQKEGEDIYDFPDSSADESTKSKSAVKSPKVAKKPARRGKLATFTSKPISRKGISAPVRLSEMIATDTDTTEPSTRAPSASTSRKSTPHQPSTPPSARVCSPETALKATGTMTPKQVQLWDRLLPSDPAVPSPSALAMKDLTISGKRRAPTSVAARKLTKSQSDVSRRRIRLVDRLRASAPSSDDEPSVEGEGEENVEMVDQKMAVQKSLSGPRESEEGNNDPTQTSQSQSQSQSQSTAGGGPKITYSRIRSYLPEDSIEADLMSGLATEALQEPANFGRGGPRPASQAQKSAFDLDDDSDDDNGTGKIRTIHELRASGSNTRGMWDIEEALEDIKQRNVSQRGRRRTALIELATKLSEKSFAARFTGQSCESQLAAECGACPDEIADFALAATIALIVASEPPEHTIKSLHEQGVATWLAQHLQHDTEISTLARDRRNNMSKASQKSLSEFSNMLKTQTSLWNEDTPLVMTPRLIALKALDQLVGKIRRLGNKTELLSAPQLEAILRNPGEATKQDRNIDMALSVSLLESLSTASLSLNWPSRVVTGITEIVPRLDTAMPLLRHALFLALRLCLNLTNENKRNCALLAPATNPTMVQFLMRAIKNGFETLDTENDDEKRTVALDFLVLAIGIMINVSEHCADARDHAVSNPDLLASLVEIFQQGHKHMLEAESVEESISNVTFGYLAVMLANLCQSSDAKAFIAAKLPGQSLRMLIEAVEEFVLHHQKVDTMNFDGEEGKEVWGAFTEKLRVVLVRLKEVEYGG